VQRFVDGLISLYRGTPAAGHPGRDHDCARPASGPIPTFASRCCKLRSKCRNQRTT